MAKEQTTKKSIPINKEDQEIPISKLSINLSAVVGLIVAIVSILWGAFITYAEMDKTLTVTKSELNYLKEEMQEMRQLLKGDITELEEDVKVVQADLKTLK